MVEQLLASWQPESQHPLQADVGLLAAAPPSGALQSAGLWSTFRNQVITAETLAPLKLHNALWGLGNF